jgi:hypothetical protein
MPQRAKIGCLGYFGIVLVILIASGALWFWASFPTASYRYRLTIVVEADRQTHSGSSVIEVRYRFNPQFWWPVAGMYELSVKGQAVVVDLGAHGVLVAALGDNHDPYAVAAAFLAGRAFQPEARRGGAGGDYDSTLGRLHSLSQMKRPANLTPDNMPPFIRFTDKTDPASGQRVKPNGFAAAIGDAAQLISAQVEITRDPVVIDIDEKLPLYKRLPLVGDNTSLNLPNGLILNWSMFIAPGSVK